MKTSEIDKYIESFDGTAVYYLNELRALINKAVPGCEELMNYNIPAFSLVKGGKREQEIMIAGYKKHVGLYPHPTTMEKSWDRLEGYKKAKGSVQFPLNKPLPKELIQEMILHRLDLLAT